MKNKGFTLIELFVVMAIIGILTAVIFQSIKTAGCKSGRLEASKCDGIEVVEQKTTSAVADKFDRTKTTPIQKTIGIEEYEASLKEPTVDDYCGGIPPSETAIYRECVDNFRRSQNLQDCINRYSN